MEYHLQPNSWKGERNRSVEDLKNESAACVQFFSPSCEKKAPPIFRINANAMKKEYDVFVIGTGNAAQNVALACAKAKLKVGITDNREYGGTCPNRGCNPKKILVGLAEILSRTAYMKGKGILKDPVFDWADLIKFKSEFTDPVPANAEEKLKKAGIDLYHASPAFLNKTTLLLEDEEITAEKIIIATGQIPRSLPFEGAEYAKISDDFLSLEQLPKSMTFIGGGYIAMEFAHIAARCGVAVSVIQSGPRPLKNFDADMVKHLVDASEEIGIRFYFNAKATKIEKLDDKEEYRVYADQDGEELKIKTGMVFNTSGRVPAIETLQLENAAISYTKKGVEVNDKMQSITNERIYACGDVADSPGLPLIPLTSVESKVVISQLLDDKPRTAKYAPQPSVVFSVPNLARVGLSEEEAKEKYKKILVYKRDAGDWYNAARIGSHVYAYKLIIDEERDRIVGAHLIGDEAGEIINLFSLAMSADLTTEQIMNAIFVHPTWGRDIKAMIKRK